MPLGGNVCSVYLRRPVVWFHPNNYRFSKEPTLCHCPPWPEETSLSPWTCCLRVQIFVVSGLRECRSSGGAREGKPRSLWLRTVRTDLDSVEASIKKVIPTPRGQNYVVRNDQRCCSSCNGPGAWVGCEKRERWSEQLSLTAKLSQNEIESKSVEFTISVLKT